MLKKLIIFVFALLSFLPLFSQTVTIIEASPWLESATITWQSLTGAEKYEVYYSGEGINNNKIDEQLIRDYGSYFRADLLGLKAGTYTIEVRPVISGQEKAGTKSSAITVMAHDRSGFAFSNGHVPGAYKADGTPKDNAVILYVTENTKNLLSLNVLGANANPCVGLETILEGFKKGKDTRPLIVRLVGQITDLSYMDGGDIVLENDNNASGSITFEGVGDDAVADGWGIRVKNASNIEIRNIGLMNCNSDEGDNIGLQQSNEYVWVHHCDYFYGDAGGDADQAKGDGALDCKKSTYVTFSYNHFWDSGKCNLLGLSENTTTGLYITFHHNWYDHSDSRHPRVRFYSAHVYNNYYDGNAKYGVGATNGSSVFVEANYFRHCKYPILTSMQGSDVYDESKGANDYSDMPTFSKEDGGSIKAFNNYMIDQRRFVAYGNTSYPNPTVDFDAYVASTRDEKVSNTIVSSRGGNQYNNFDSDASIMYTYIPDSPEAAKEKVIQYAGRMYGGDFKWTFNNSIDDIADAVDPKMKTALIDYQTSIVAIQGDSISNGEIDPEEPTGEEINEALTHNFTTNGIVSSNFVISGNLSDSKGTVSYEGLSLTQCLKIESSTTISFSTSEETTLLLVFNTNFSGKINIDGNSYTAINGILSVTLPAGMHEISKGDSCNLYYISITFEKGNNSGNGLSYIKAVEINLYPNPAENYLKILSLAEVKKVEFYTMKGSLVKSAKADFTMIDISHIKAGSYVIRVYTNRGTFNKTFVKK
ncbi:MAG: T9SS type A sorting domain-containing protein [Prolixibacteraceae bacterium]